MLNEKRVKLMTQMAMYETKEGKEDFKVSAYYQRDYASLNTWITAVWSTIGYAIVAGALLLVYLEKILDNASLASMVVLAGVIVIGYIMTIIISAIISYEFYRKKHMDARKRVKKFNHDLISLGKMYEKETR